MKKHISIFLVLAAVATVCWSAAPKGYNKTVVSGGQAQTDIVGEVKIYDSLNSTSESFNIKGGTATLTQIIFGDGTTMETAATGTGSIDLADIISASSTWTGTQTLGYQKLIANAPSFTGGMTFGNNWLLNIDEPYWVLGNSAYSDTDIIYVSSSGVVGIGYGPSSVGYPPAGYTFGVNGRIYTNYGITTSSITFTDGTVMITAATGSGEEFLVSPTTGIIAGVLASDVIASSVAINTIGIDHLQATGAGDYLKKDGTWTTPSVGSVAANEITAGTMDTDVIASSVGVTAVGPTQMQNAKNYNLNTSSITVSQVTATNVVAGSLSADYAIISGDISANSISTSGSSGSLTGTITNISTVTFARINTIKFGDGTVITSTATIGGGTGDGDFLADGTVPMTGDLDMGDQNIVSASSITATNTIYASSISATNGVYASEFYATQKTTPSKLSFWEGSGSGENKITIQSSTTLAGDLTFTLPAADGSSGHVLKTDGAGAMYWGATSGTGDFLADGTVPMTGNLDLDSQWIVGVTTITGVASTDLIIQGHSSAGTFLMPADGCGAGIADPDTRSMVLGYQDATNKIMAYADMESTYGLTMGTMTVSSCTVTNLTVTGTLNATVAVGAADITAGAMDADVIVSSIGAGAFAGYAGQVVSNGIKVSEKIPLDFTILGSTATLPTAFRVTPFFQDAVDVSTTSIRVTGGADSQMVYMFEVRPKTAPASAGNDLFTGDATAVSTGFTGGTQNGTYFAIPAGSALFLVPTSFSGTTITNIEGTGYATKH